MAAFLWALAMMTVHAADGPILGLAYQNLPLAGLSLGESTLSHTGSYGADGSYGIFAYTGVAGFSATPERPVRPGSKLVDTLPGAPSQTAPEWAPQFSGSFYRKLSELDFRGAANAFVDKGS